ELTLRRGSFRSLRRDAGARVDAILWEVPEDHAQLLAELLAQPLYYRKRLEAMRALVIAVLEQGDRGGLRSLRMVLRFDGDQQSVRIGVGIGRFGHRDMMLSTIGGGFTLDASDVSDAGDACGVLPSRMQLTFMSPMTLTA